MATVKAIIQRGLGMTRGEILRFVIFSISLHFHPYDTLALLCV